MLRKQLKTVLEEAAVALKEVLRVRVNINRSIIIWCYSQVNKQQLQEVPKEEDSELKITVRRNQMMQKLLAVLDSAAALGNGPALTDFMPEVTCTHDLKKASGIKRYTFIHFNSVSRIKMNMQHIAALRHTNQTIILAM